MKTYTIGKHTLTLYQSIKELPARLFSEMQKFLLQDAGIGADMSAVNSHLNKLDMFLAAGDIDSARQERINLQQNIFIMLNAVTIENYSFGCLIHSVDGQPVTDYSETNLKEIIGKLSEYGLTYGQISDTLNEVKKNWIQN